MPSDIPPPQAQITKQQAGYQLTVGQPQQCATCSMSRGGNCVLVAGIIEPYAVCKFWEPVED